MAFTTLTDDKFYYGRRQLIDYDRTAQPTYGYEPLTPEDFLDPQEHDTFNHGPRHDQVVLRLYAIFRQHYRVNPLVAVFTGVKLVWDIPELAQPVADVVVVPGAESWDSQRTQVNVAAEGTRPTLIIEAVSPRFVAGDLEHKVGIYAAAGVQEYFIVDSGEREDRSDIAYRVIGYRLRDGVYQPIAADEQGRLYSETARVWFMPTADRQQIDIISKRTGQPIEPDPNSLTSPAAARAEATFRANSIASRLNLGQDDS
ncbi:MAG: Uma2 family endonuclease [Caldilineaceae bacterium]|nr:Uma2 family endonuclease [Caldilineaceae bacterium]